MSVDKSTVAKIASLARIRSLLHLGLSGCGTVTEAARQLGVSQPSVTTTIKQAEAGLGLRLFRREAGRLVPTAEARILFEEAERAHDALAALKGRLGVTLSRPRTASAASSHQLACPELARWKMPVASRSTRARELAARSGV